LNNVIVTVLNCIKTLSLFLESDNDIHCRKRVIEHFQTILQRTFLHCIKMLWIYWK